MFVTVAPPALAEGQGGEYSVGPTKVKVNIHSWGEDCGPKPKSYTSKGKGKVTVSEKGDHLFFSNGRSTKKCWSANIKLQRLSVTKKGNTWTIVCKSPQSDSRQEHGKYVVTASGSKIQVKDTSNYNWKLKESICKATIIIERVFTKGTAGEQPPEEPPPEKKPPVKPAIETDYPEQPPPKKCKETGPPVRITVSPSSTTTSPGHKVCFSAYSVDKNGCRLHVKPKWRLVKENPDRAGKLDGSCFVPGDNAADSEGVFRVIADYSYYSASAKIVVKSQFIEDLIAINLDPSGAGEASAVEPEAAAEAPGAEEHVDVPVASGRRFPTWLVWVVPPVLILVALGAIMAFVVVGRRRKLKKRIVELEAQRMGMQGREVLPSSAPRESGAGSGEPPPARQRKQAQIPPTPGSANQPAAPAATGPVMLCRVCGREHEPGSMFCPHDGSALVPADSEKEEAHETGMICPRCGRGYPQGSRNCGEDGEMLVPAPVADAGLDQAGEKSTTNRKLICPACSTVYEDGSTFCGNDGVRLVPMN